MQLRSQRLHALSADLQMKMYCSVYGCVLRAISADNCAAESLTVLLFDVLSAIHDKARHSTESDMHTTWLSNVERLMHAESEVEWHSSHDLSAVTKKLKQMQDYL